MTSDEYLGYRVNSLLRFATVVTCNPDPGLHVQSYPGTLMTAESMIEITNALIIGPDPDLSRVGRR